MHKANPTIKKNKMNSKTRKWFKKSSFCDGEVDHPSNSS